MTITFNIQDTKYSIEADGNQYILNRHGINNAKGENFGKETLNFIGYYSQVKNAVQRSVKDAIGNSPDEITLSEFISRYEACVESINEQIGDK
jgi:hypothetical protein